MLLFALFFAEEGAGRLVLILAGVEPVIVTARGEQLVVSALLNDLSVLDHQDDVRVADGGQSMGDHDGGPAADDRVDRVLDLLLGDRVDRSSGLVEHQDTRIGQDRACKGDQLLFAGREHVAALAHVGLQSLFQARDHLVGRDELQRPLDLLIRCIRVRIQQVFPYRAGEEMRCLEDIADRAVQPELRALARVAPVDQYAALRRLVEAADEVCERGFARAGLAHDGHVRAKGDL